MPSATRTSHRSMRIYHWLYIALLASLAVGRLLQKISTDTGGFASRYAPVIVVAILIAGLVGYLRKTPLLQRWVWIACFWVLALASAGTLMLGGYLLITSGSAMLLLTLLIVVGIALVTPALVALFRYAHRSPGIWSTGETETQ